MEDPAAEDALAQANTAKAQGNIFYGEGKYEEALECYATALGFTSEDPDWRELRAMCHSNRAICFLQLNQYEGAVTESTKALDLNPSYLKALIRRSQAYEKLQRFDEAIGDMKKIQELEPGNKQAAESIRRLTPLAEAKREELKEEMIGKLKEVGNSVLGYFGMSIDNFKAVKDPATGSYSISMQK